MERPLLATRVVLQQLPHAIESRGEIAMIELEPGFLLLCHGAHLKKS
jgi:hypothetical protein